MAAVIADHQYTRPVLRYSVLESAYYFEGDYVVFAQLRCEVFADTIPDFPRLVTIPASGEQSSHVLEQKDTRLDFCDQGDHILIEMIRDDLPLLNICVSAAVPDA